MNSIRSAVALRTLLVDTLAEMLAINSTILPDGATAYESQSDTLYRLDKSAGNFYDSLIGSGVVVKPDDTTDARWFAEATVGSSPYFFESYLDNPVAVTLTQNEWKYLGSTAGSFLSSFGNTSLFTLNPTTGELTYNGPARQVLVTMQASVNNGTGATSVAIHACISRAGDVVPASTIDHPEKGEQAQNVINVFGLITVQRAMLLNPGTKIQLAFRNTTNSDDIVATYYQATVAPL